LVASYFFLSVSYWLLVIVFIIVGYWLLVIFFLLFVIDC